MPREGIGAGLRLSDRRTLPIGQVPSPNSAMRMVSCWRMPHGRVAGRDAICQRRNLHVMYAKQKQRRRKSLDNLPVPMVSQAGIRIDQRRHTGVGRLFGIRRGIGQHADGANANQRIYSAIRIADYIMNGAKAVTTVSRCSRGSPASLGTELLHNVGAGAIHPTSRWTLCAEWDAAVKARYASGNRTDDAIIRYRPATAPSAPDPGSSPPTLRGTADRPWCRPDRRCCQGRT